MKNILRLSAAALSIFFAAASTEASAQATATATATATIVTPISLTKTLDMDFGNVAVNATSAGTVELTPAGSRVAAGGVTLPATAGSVAAAAFTVDGQANYTYAITLPTGVHQISNGAVNMNVTGFSSLPSTTGTLDANGTQALTVGATLTVGAAQPAGIYTSTTPFSVMVNYN